MRPFTGFHLDEMRRFIHLAYVYEEFRQLEQPAGRQIRAFLKAVGEETRARFTAANGQVAWKTKVRRVRLGAINWTVDLVSELYPDVTFNIWLYYFPRRHYNHLLYAAVGLALRSRAAVSSLALPICARFSSLREQNDWAAAGTMWEQGLAGGDYEEYAECLPGLAWERLEKWQDTRDYLVNRAVAWHSEFWPIIERPERPVGAGDTVRNF